MRLARHKVTNNCIPYHVFQTIFDDQCTPTGHMTVRLKRLVTLFLRSSASEHTRKRFARNTQRQAARTLLRVPESHTGREKRGATRKQIPTSLHEMNRCLPSFTG